MLAAGAGYRNAVLHADRAKLAAILTGDGLIVHSGGVSHQLHRCSEDPGKYLLLVRSRRVEDHTFGFRHSAEHFEMRFQGKA